VNDDDRNFEAFLREFEPRSPRPLPASESTSRAWPALAAAASLILVLGAASLWIEMRRIDSKKSNGNSAANISGAATNQLQPMSTLALTRAALENSSEFEKEMDSRALRDLPAFNRKESMLRVLAKE
jgi:hypothetical protein